MNRAPVIPILVALTAEATLLGYTHATSAIPIISMASISSILETPLLVLAGSVLAFSVALYYNMEAVPGRRSALEPGQATRNGLFLSFIFNSILLSPYILSSNAVAGIIGATGSISEALASIDSGVKYAVVQLLSSTVTVIAAAVLTSLRTQPRLR